MSNIELNGSIDPEVIRKIRKLKNDLPLFARTCLKVVTTSGDLEPLLFNASQMYLHNFIEDQKKSLGMVRVVVLKGRKQGVSTYTAARFLHQAIFSSTKQVFILSHHSSTTNVLFNIVATFYRNLPDQLKLKLLKDNDKYMMFENGSQYTVATAGVGEIGRGDTPHYLHGSEVASWEKTDQLETGILTAVGDAPGTEVVLESTAKGIGNLFHTQCMASIQHKSDYRLCFLPWTLHEDNYKTPSEDFELSSEEMELKQRYSLSNGQLAFRRNKIGGYSNGEWKFKQEFPFTVQEAFQNSGEKFFSLEAIDRARKSTLTDHRQPLIIGCDPARDGDRTVLAYRRGRQIEKIRTFDKMEEMQLAGILGKAINEEHVDQVFLDVAHGYGTVDRLNELGFGRVVTGIHFGASKTLLEPQLYHNKRAEMYGNFKDWLEKEDTRIPDEDDLATDLMSIPEAKVTSSGKMLLMLKVDIKKESKISPDIADACALTFAFSVKNRNTDVEGGQNMRYNTGKSNQNKSSIGGLDSPIMGAFNTRQPKGKDKFGFNNHHKR